ncbi:MAG TPA: retropepsin-like aspartic protease [Blastocatellia bacterium]|nr:retropepsin-like aspartic protease [Blastocatellia bacterium]
MPFLLDFNIRYEYNSLRSGIFVPVTLRLGGTAIPCDAEVDTGAQVCVSQRELGVSLGLEVETGHRIVLSSLGGAVVAFGHFVTLHTLGLEFDSVVYFAEDYNLPRNLLGRDGWLRKLRLAVVDYDAEIYLSPHDSG